MLIHLYLNSYATYVSDNILYKLFSYIIIYTLMESLKEKLVHQKLYCTVIRVLHEVPKIESQYLYNPYILILTIKI